MLSVCNGDPKKDLYEIIWFSDFEVLSRILWSKPWSGICWLPGRRASSRFYCAQYAVFDFDGEEHVSCVRKKVSSFKHFIGFTKSHRRVREGESTAPDRFRLILEFEESVWDVRDYQHSLKCFAIAMSFACDEQGFDGARWWAPCNDEYGSHWKDVGHKVPLMKAPPLKKISRKKAKKFSQTYHQVLNDEVHEGMRNISLYKAACSAFVNGSELSDVVDEFQGAVPWFDEVGGLSTVKSAYRFVKSRSEI